MLYPLAIMGSWYRYEPLEDSILSTRWHACCLLIARRESKHMLAKILDGARRKNASYQVRALVASPRTVLTTSLPHVASRARSRHSHRRATTSRRSRSLESPPPLSSLLFFSSSFLRFFFRNIHPRPSRT